MTDWQNRLSSEVKLVPANQLLANPQNPRRHPSRQREALRGSLDTLGFVAPVLVSKRSQFMLDGHARVEEALSKDENTLIPVLEVDLEAYEESLFLASFDYITYMAEYDRDSLDALLRDVSTDDNRLQAMLSELAETERLLDGMNTIIGQSPAEALEVFENAAIKQVVLYFGLAEYDDFVTRLEAICEAQELENNTEVVVWLLEFYEHHQS